MIDYIPAVTIYTDASGAYWWRIDGMPVGGPFDERDEAYSDVLSKVLQCRVDVE